MSLVWGFWLSLWLHQAPADPEARLEEFVRRWEGLPAAAGRFEQVFRAPGVSERTRISGRFFVSGERFRIEAGEQLFVGDGQAIWIYDRRARRALVLDYGSGSDLDWSVPALLRGRWRDRFRVREYAVASSPEGKPALRFRLEARTPGTSPAELWLWVERASGLPVRLELRDPAGEPVQIRLWAWQLDLVLGPDRFRFVPPPGTELLDRRRR